MKIFDSSPDIKLNRPRRWKTAFTLATAMVLVLVAVIFNQRYAYEKQIEQAKRELADERAAVTALKKQVEIIPSLQEKLDAASAKFNSCASNVVAETSKVAAFAKQAAACEVIRKKLNLKG